MKLATLPPFMTSNTIVNQHRHDDRDGRLVVVNKNLTRYIPSLNSTDTLQHALENWDLAKHYLDIEVDDIEDNMLFLQGYAYSPLPRAYQWLDGSAYLNHVELVRKARGAEMPESFLTDPLMYQGSSDKFLGPHEDILAASEDYGIDFEAEVAVIVTDVPQGIPVEKAGEYIALIMLVNDVSLRNLIPNELQKGFGFIHGKPPTTFSPVAVTPDELGDAWQDYKVHLPLTVWRSNEKGIIDDVKFGEPNAGQDMQFNFAELIAHAAHTRPLRAGTIIGSGTVSNKDESVGACCIAEKRMIETIKYKKPKTPFLKFGESVKIEMLKDEQSIFGSIEQVVRRYKYV